MEGQLRLLPHPPPAASPKGYSGPAPSLPTNTERALCPWAGGGCPGQATGPEFESRGADSRQEAPTHLSSVARSGTTLQPDTPRASDAVLIDSLFWLKTKEIKNKHSPDA